MAKNVPPLAIPQPTIGIKMRTDMAFQQILSGRATSQSVIQIKNDCDDGNAAINPGR